MAMKLDTPQEQANSQKKSAGMKSFINKLTESTKKELSDAQIMSAHNFIISSAIYMQSAAHTCHDMRNITWLFYSQLVL